jgi:hypothetical protein
MYEYQDIFKMYKVGNNVHKFVVFFIREYIMIGVSYINNEA